MIGYYVADQALDESEILSYLAECLPAYMRLTFLIRIQHIPLTINGKIDQKSLVKPDLRSANSNFDAPKTATELRLAMIWCDVLNLDECFSVSTSFFELGGSSLLSITMLGRINTDFSIAFTLKDIFEKFTIRDIAVKIDLNTQLIWSPLVPINAQSNDKPNLYILPGIIGCSSAYYPLGNILSRHFSVSIIEAKGLYGDCEPVIDFKEMLNEYYSAIVNNENTKIIYLVAHSAGCNHTVELCYKLRRNGFFVQVVLLDGPVFWSGQNNTIEEDSSILLLKAIKELYALSHLENIFDHSKSSITQQIADYLFSNNAINNQYKLKVAKGFIKVFNAQMNITKNHKKSTRYNSCIAIYIASIENKKREACAQSFHGCYSDVYLDVTAGGHLSMLNKHYVNELAEKIIDWLLTERVVSPACNEWGTPLSMSKNYTP